MQTIENPTRGKRVAMLVSNPCNPDYRVVKQAESLARSGYDVRIYGTWNVTLGIPVRETINDVTYCRYEWSALKILRMVLFGEAENIHIPKLGRDKYKDKINRDTDKL